MQHNLLKLPLLWAGILLMTLGCGMATTPEAEFDSLVEEVWLDVNQGNLVDAVDYLSNGGTHHDVTPDTTVDQDFTLPLCRKLNELEGITVQALLYDDDTAGFTTDLMIELPAEPATRSKIQSIITEMDEEYSGTINNEWGYKWLAITFDEE